MACQLRGAWAIGTSKTLLRLRTFQSQFDDIAWDSRRLGRRDVAVEKGEKLLVKPRQAIFLRPADHLVCTTEQR